MDETIARIEQYRPDPAATIQTDTGLELRVGFSESNLIHSQLSRTGDDALLERAEDLRLVLLGQG